MEGTEPGPSLNGAPIIITSPSLSNEIYSPALSPSRVSGSWVSRSTPPDSPLIKLPFWDQELLSNWYIPTLPAPFPTPPTWNWVPPTAKTKPLSEIEIPLLYWSLPDTPCKVELPPSIFEPNCVHDPLEYS